MFSSFTDSLEIDMESLLSSSSSRFGFNQEEEEQELCSIFPSLTWQQRVGGCIGCMVLGYVLSFGSFMRMRDLIVYGDPCKFYFFEKMEFIASQLLFRPKIYCNSLVEMSGFG